MPILMFTVYQLTICTYREVRTPINSFGDCHATIAPYTYYQSLIQFLDRY